MSCFFSNMEKRKSSLALDPGFFSLSNPGVTPDTLNPSFVQQVPELFFFFGPERDQTDGWRHTGAAQSYSGAPGPRSEARTRAKTHKQLHI